MNKQELTFRPLSRQIGSYTKNQFLNCWEFNSFRPLSRQIGSYTPYFVVGFKNKHKI